MRSILTIVLLTVLPGSASSQTPSSRPICPELLDSVAHVLGWGKLNANGADSEFRLWRNSCAWIVPDHVIRVVRDERGTRGEAVIWWTTRAMELMDSVQVDTNKWTTWQRALEIEHECQVPVIRNRIGFCRWQSWSSETWERAWQIFNEHHGWDLTQTEGLLGLDGFEVILEAAGSGKRVLLTYWMPGPGRTVTEREVFQLEQDIYRLLYPKKSP